MSERGIPQIACVMGSCTAGGAYVPAMSDETVIVRDQGTIFLGGPPLVKAATGEEVTAEELGGGDVHARTSRRRRPPGRRRRARAGDRALASSRRCRAQPDAAVGARRAARPPAEDPRRPARPRPAGLAHALRRPRAAAPASSTAASCTSSRRSTARRVVCAFAHLDGHPVGIIANNGILFSESALKAAHFIELCDRRVIPLLFVQNISGFMVGRDYEAGGHRQGRREARHGGLVRARARSSRSSSAAPSARATTACAAAPTRRASCSCGPTRASP